MTNKESIRLREREVRNGNKSLYLDIYRGGKRAYEFLKLYIVPETCKADKEKNRNTYRLAEAIKAQRIIDLQNGEYGFTNKAKAKNVLFFKYIQHIADEHERAGATNTASVWRNAIRHLAIYETNTECTLADITPKWIEGFKAYLSNAEGREREDGSRTLARNSQRLFLDKLRACMRRAVRDEILQRTPFDKVENIKGEDVEREYLTREEVSQLAALRHNPKVVKDVCARAFLFSCLTGLRWSDINKLTWANISTIEGSLSRITFRQKKTHGQEYLDITPQAVTLLGSRPVNNEQRVFELPSSLMAVNLQLKRWTQAAGIDKHITFHCARHTFAIMMLDLGTDLYTVSKLLGHRNLSTTQIYAKVLDKNKQKAVLNIPELI